jgi:plasmid stabilization system protein ParE
VKRYRFTEEAEAEFQEQILYYDEQVAGLGDKFIADVEATIQHIRKYPEGGFLKARNVRQRVLRVFHHNVYYVNEPDEIFIVAVAPHKRRPGYWRKRLKNRSR